MNKAVQAAQKAARKAIEGTYTGLLKVTEYQSVKDPVTHITLKRLLFWKISLVSCLLKR